jgi:hypothetical protein
MLFANQISGRHNVRSRPAHLTSGNADTLDDRILRIRTSSISINEEHDRATTVTKSGFGHGNLPATALQGPDR